MPPTKTLKKKVAVQKRLARRLAGLEGKWVAVRGPDVVSSAPTLGGLLSKVDKGSVDRVFRVPKRKARLLL